MGIFGGPAWTDAEDSGRIRPGRGPLFTRRVYPFRAPALRRDALRDGVPRRTVDRADRPVRGVVLPPEDDYDGPARLGPDGWCSEDPGPYLWDIITRLRACWLLAPAAVGGAWCAAAAHGLPHWADSEQVLLHSGRMRRNPTGPGTPVYRPLPKHARTVCVDPLFPELKVVDAATAAAQCLATILSGKKQWWVPTVPGLTDREVRAVQFIDAYYQCTHLTDTDILAGARNIVDRVRLAALLELCDQGAESPMETVLRLVVRDELPAGHAWTSQVTVSLADGVVVDGATFRGKRTTPDLACPALKVALYYDGAHHEDQEQTETDFRMFQALKKIGWEAVRINRDLLNDRAELLEHIRGAIVRAGSAARTTP
jgi:hypothetical protein